jgi:hypothetical protein
LVRGCDACFVGDDDQLRTVAAAQFAQESADVSLRCPGANVQGGGDLAVGQPLRDLGEDFDLSLAEVF